MKFDKLHATLSLALVIGIILVIVAGVIIKGKATEFENLQADAALSAMKFEELEKGLVRAESQLVTEKELRREIKEVFSTQFDIVLSDLAELKAKPSIVHHTTSVVEGDTSVFEDTDYPSKYKFLTKDGMSVAEYEYKDRQFRAKTFDLTVNSGIVISEDKHGNRVAHICGTISSSDTEDSGNYPLEIVNSKLSFIKPDKLEMMFAPHLDAGISIGYNGTEKKGVLHGSLGISFLSIGTTKSDNILRFGHIRGIVSSGSAGIGIDPAGLNIAKPLPLVDDIWLWVGPTFATDGTHITATISSTF